MSSSQSNFLLPWQFFQRELTATNTYVRAKRNINFQAMEYGIELFIAAACVLCARRHDQMQGRVEIFHEDQQFFLDLSVDSYENCAQLLDQIRFELQITPYRSIIAVNNATKLIISDISWENWLSHARELRDVYCVVNDNGFELIADCGLCSNVELDSLVASLAYITEQFNSERLLGSISHDPNQANVLTNFTGEICDLGDTENTMVQAIFHHIETVPHKKAIEIGLGADYRYYTYQELGAIAKAIAVNVRQAHIGLGDIIAIALCPGLEVITALVGVMASGAAFVAIDLDYPDERISYILENSGAKMLISDATGLARILQFAPQLSQLHCVDINALMQADTSKIETYEIQSVPLNTPAYLVYTSGSTGKPKGAIITHDGIGSLIATGQKRMGANCDSRVMKFASIAFDVTAFELCLSLCLGATLVIIPADLRVGGRELTEYIVAHNLTIGILPPSLMNALPQECVFPENFTVLVGTEIVPQEIISRWAVKMNILNAYGLTEATTNSTLWPIQPHWQGSLPIGYPDPNTCCYILDSALHPVPIGVIGELYVGGRGVALGYIGQSALTATRFIADPFIDNPHYRMYRTGDKASWNHDGTINYHGRTDSQIKIRGYRIEPGEIEAVLTAQAGVLQAYITVKEQQKIKRLVAYVVTEPGHTVIASQLKDRTTKLLPEYMVPSCFVISEKPLALTVNGKIDHKALPEPDYSLLISEELPVGEIESALTTIFAQILGLDQVGPRDDFFAIGGDSISAITVVSTARSVGIALRPRDIFLYQNARSITENLPEKLIDIVHPAINQPATGKIYPTPILAWLHEVQSFLSPQNQLKHYYQAVCLNIPEDVTLEALEHTILALWETHDILRAKLNLIDHSLFIEPLESANKIDACSFLQVIDCAELRGENQYRDIVDNLAAQLNPTKSEMMKCAWLRSDKGNSRLLIAIHHSVIDGVSWRIIVHDLREAYNQYLMAGTISLPKVETSYRAWSTLLRDTVQTREIEREFWSRQMETQYPALGKRYADPRMDFVKDTLEKIIQCDNLTTIALINTLPAAYHCTVNDIFLAALAVALDKFYRSIGYKNAPISIDVEGHGREDIFDGVDLSRTLGWFTNVYPVYLKLESYNGENSCYGDSSCNWESFCEGEAAVGVVIALIKEQLHTIADKGIGYGQLRYLQDAMQFQPTHNPSFQGPQVLFNYLGRFTQNYHHIEDQVFTPAADFPPMIDMRDPEMPLGHTLTLDAIVADTMDGAMCSIQIAYLPHILSEPLLDRFIGYLKRAIDGMAKHAQGTDIGGKTRSDFPLCHLTEEEFSEFNQDLICRIPALAMKNMSTILPTTSLQQGLFFHSQLETEEKDLYVVQLILELQGQVNHIIVQEAFNIILEKHKALRAGFWASDHGKIIQFIPEKLDIPFEFIDVSMSASEDKARQISQIISEKNLLHFDFLQPPLMDISLIRTASENFTLVVTMHHILSDGWSESIIITDLLEAYDAIATEPIGQQIDLSGPDYVKYCSWLAAQDQCEALRAWTEILDGVTAGTLVASELSLFDRPHFSEITGTIAQADALAIHMLCQSLSITVNTFFQGIWALILGGYTCRNDILFGSTVTGRPGQIPGIDSMVGLFINTIPIRVNWTDNQLFTQMLQILQNRQSQVLDYHHIGLASLRSIIGGGELFDTYFMYENMPLVEKELATKDFQVTHRLTDDNDHYMMSLIITPGNPGTQETPGEDFRYLYKYNTDHIPAATSYAVAQIFPKLIQQIIQNPQLLVGQMLQTVVHDLHGTFLQGDNLAVSTQGSIVEVIRASIRSHSDRIALIEGDAPLTYEQLFTRAEEFSQELKNYISGSEAHISVSLPRSTELVIAALGVWLASAVYVPIDPENPPGRQELYRTIANVHVDIGPGLTINPKNNPGDAGTNQILRQPKELPDQSLAYCIFTSGTTGMPKAVGITHANTKAFLAGYKQEYPLTINDKVLMKTSPSFDVSILELLWPLAQGATLIIAEEGGHRDPEYLCELINSHKITAMDFTPTLLGMFIHYVQTTHQAAAIASLKLITVGGEALPENLYRKWSHISAAQLINTYGPTETTVQVSTYKIPKIALEDSEETDVYVPLGNPVPGTSLSILNEHLLPVKIGEIGELYIHGPQIARGYEQGIAETAIHFVADPTGNGTRMYRSGDLVRIDQNGNLHFCGRSDAQVKIRGQRVETGEISCHLEKHPKVLHAHTILMEEKNKVTLVSFVILAPDAEQEDSNKSTVDAISQLSQYISEIMPETLIPSIMPIQHMPMSSSGKIDLVDLQTLWLQRNTVSSAGIVLAKNTTEHTDMQLEYQQYADNIIEVFGRVLDCDTITAHTDFFRAGGDSISAITVALQLKRRHIAVTARQIFSHRTPQAIAQHYAKNSFSQKTHPHPVKHDSYLIPSNWNPTPIMSHLFSTGEYESYKTFHLSQILALPDDITIIQVQEIITQLIQAHPIFTSKLHITHIPAILDNRDNSQNTKQIYSFTEQHISDISPLTVEKITYPIEDWVKSASLAAVKKLDPSQGKMLNCIIGQSNTGRNEIMILAVHHLAVDGVSWRIILAELQAAYQQILQGEPIKIPAESTSFAQYAHRLQALAVQYSILARAKYWIDLVTQTAPIFAILSRSDVKNTMVTYQQTQLHIQRINPLLSDKILSFILPDGVHDPAALLLAVLGIALKSSLDYEIHQPILIDVERHGRDVVEECGDLSSTIGWFTAIQPIQVDCQASLVNLASLIHQQLQSDTLGGVEFGLLKYLNPQTTQIFHSIPNAQILFNYYGRFPACEDQPWKPSIFHSNLPMPFGPNHPVEYGIELDIIALESHNHITEIELQWRFHPELDEKMTKNIVREMEQALAHIEKLENVHPVRLTGMDITPEQVNQIKELIPVPIDEIWALSPLQEGIFFEEQFSGPEASQYVAQTQYQWENSLNSLNKVALTQALRKLLQRHASLRAGFIACPDNPLLQFISSNPELLVHEVDLRECTENAHDRAAELAFKARIKPFDLGKPPLLRILLLRMPNGYDRLIMTNHLLLWDGWSETQIRTELFTLYFQEIGLMLDMDLGISGNYRDYIAWLAEQDIAAAENIWKEELKDITEPSLVAQGQRLAPALPGRIYGALSQEDTQALYHAAQNLGVTLNSLVTGCWALVLRTLLGKNDVVFGSTVAERPVEIDLVDNTVGLFLSTVPTRIHCNPYHDLAEFFLHIHKNRLTVMDNGYIGLGKILQQSPFLQLFDTLFVFQNFHQESGNEKDNFLSQNSIKIIADEDATHYPLALVINPDKTLSGYLDYREEIFTEQKAQHICDQFFTLLSSITQYILSQENVTLGELPILCPSEMSEIQALWNGVKHNEPHNLVITDYLWEKINTIPHNIALVWEDSPSQTMKTMSYAQMGKIIARLSRWFIAQGIKPGDIIALHLDRDPYYVISIFAILSLGATYLPLDLSWPAARTQGIIDETQPVIILTSPGQDQVWSYHSPIPLPIQCLDKRFLQETLVQFSSQPMQGQELGLFADNYPARQDLTAYLTYTSGSTGKPKAVMTRQKGLVNMLLNHRENIFTPTIASRDQARLAIAHTVPFTFDMSWEEMLWLIEGHEVHICDENLRRDGPALTRYCHKYNIDVINVTPTYAQHLVNEGLFDPHNHQLALMLLGGEEVPASLWDTINQASATKGYNLYGPTEYTINALGTDISQSATPSLGRPIRATQALVLDDYLQATPIGTAGELYLTGIGISPGYLQQNALTATRFVANPYGTQSGDLMYRTGDKVRINDQGQYEYLGRVDNQIKIRGHRIELSEIISTLEANDLVKQAQVIPDKSVDNTRLIGYIIASDNGRKLSDEALNTTLKTILRAQLPDYMVPFTIMPVAQFTMTSNGKLDISALPTPITWSNTKTSTDYALSPLHNILIQIFEQVLKVQGIGLSDNFFDLGGHSLLAISMVNIVKKQLQVPLSIKDLFTHPYIGDLAEFIIQQNASIEKIPLAKQIASTQQDKNIWLQRWRPFDKSHQPVILFGPAGANAHYYHAVAVDIPQRFDPLAINLPGRASRIHEPGIRSMEEMVEAITHVIIPILLGYELPAHIIGHSMGASVGFEVARALEQQGMIPASLSVAGRADPHSQLHYPAAHNMSDAELVEVLMELGGTSEKILADNEALELVLRPVKDDYALLAAYTPKLSPQLHCEIFAFRGQTDVHVDPEHMIRWGEMTEGAFQLMEIAGGHMDFLEEFSQVIAVLNNQPLS